MSEREAVFASMSTLFDFLQPILENITGVALASVVWVCLPLALFRRTRRLAGRCIQIAGVTRGIVLWFTSAMIIYGFWGWWGIATGIITGVITMIPLAVVASLIRGGTNNVPLLSMWAIGVFAVVAVGGWVTSKGEPKTEVPN